jgi:hypothetical protein
MEWVIVCSYGVIRLAVLLFNHNERYEMGSIIYFTLFPVIASLVYAAKVDERIAFFNSIRCLACIVFIKIVIVIFSFSPSVACYFAVFVL